MLSFRQADADAVIYVFNGVPRGPYTAARITIEERQQGGYEVKLEKVMKGYEHTGFVAAQGHSGHAGTWRAAERIATRFAEEYEKEGEAGEA